MPQADLHNIERAIEAELANLGQKGKDEHLNHTIAALEGIRALLPCLCRPSFAWRIPPPKGEDEKK
jgi:hypothetical protein